MRARQAIPRLVIQKCRNRIMVQAGTPQTYWQVVKQKTKTHNHAEALMKPRSETGQKESISEQAPDIR